MNPQESETVLQVRTDAIAERLATRDLRGLILDTTEDDLPSFSAWTATQDVQQEDHSVDASQVL